MLWADVAGRPAMCRVAAAPFWPGMLLLLLQSCRVKAAMLLEGDLVCAHWTEDVAASLLAEELCMMAGSELDQVSSFQPERERQASLEVAEARSFLPEYSEQLCLAAHRGQDRLHLASEQVKGLVSMHCHHALKVCR